MTRSKKGAKSPDQEYWGKRPLVNPGRQGKQIGVQKERSILKRELLKEPLEPEYDEREYIEPCSDKDCFICR